VKLLPGKYFVFAFLFTTLAARADTFTVTLLTDDGDLTCDASCTLRDAIDDAAASPEASDIEFQADLTGTITLASKLTVYGDDTRINGPGPDVITVSGDDQFIVMEIPSTSDNVAVKGLTIRDGFEDTLSGAGIVARGTNMLLENLRVIDNHNSGQGAGIYLIGGGTVRNTEISGNSGTLIVGLVVNGLLPVLIENVTISGNTAVQQTGVMYILTNTGQDVTLRYVTVADNTGGALAVNVSNPGGSTTIEASVFAGNSASSGDLSVSSDTPVNNSVIGEVSGSITLGANNSVGVDPALLPLGFVDGSAMQVHAFDEDSVAFDHVQDGVGDPQCGAEVATDQLGKIRPMGQRCDAGAFEIQPDGYFDDGFETAVLPP